MYFLFLKFKQKFNLFLLLTTVQASRGYVLNNISKYLHVYRHLRCISQEASFSKYEINQHDFIFAIKISSSRLLFEESQVS